MKMHIVTVGQPHLSFARDGFCEYIKRLGGFHKVCITHIKDNADFDVEMLAMMKGAFSVVLDEHGKEFTSIELAQFLDKKALESIGEITFFIGAPDGHSDRLKDSADVMWSLGTLTLPHDLAMLITAEALYRASTITAGHPYHRA